MEGGTRARYPHRPPAPRVTRIVVLGAGFGGLELTTRLSDEFGTGVDVVLIDKTEDFVFGFSKLEVMFGRAGSEQVRHPYRDFIKPGVQFVQSTVRRIDPSTKRVETDAGTFDADVLVVALGADLHPEATPGLLEGGYDFYTEEGAFALQDVLAAFDGGRVVVAVTSTPFKCPPAPSETALADARLPHRPGAARPVADCAGHAAPRPDPAFARRVRGATDGVRAARHRLAPEHHRPRTRPATPGRDPRGRQRNSVRPLPRRAHPPCTSSRPRVGDSRSTAGSLSTRATLETRFPGVYAVGDVTSVGTPKAGVFAEGQAAVVGRRVSARWSAAAGSRPPPTTDAASATWSSAITRWQRSTSRSSAVKRRTGRSKAHRPLLRGKRPSSARAASNAGSVAPGPRTITCRGEPEIGLRSRATVCDVA